MMHTHRGVSWGWHKGKGLGRSVKRTALCEYCYELVAHNYKYPSTPHILHPLSLPTSSIQYIQPSSPFPPHPLSTVRLGLSWLSLAFSILSSSSSSLCLLLFLSSSSSLFLSTVHLLVQPLREGRWQGWRAKGQCKIKFSSGAK